MKTRLFLNFLMIAPAMIGASFIGSNAAIASETQVDAEPVVAATSVDAATQIAQVEQYSLQPSAPVSALSNSSLAQVTSVSQLADVQPTDWAFQALQSLVERYGCIAGYPDGTYRGNRALTRFEFAAGLNACLDRVNELIAAGLADAVTREDLATLQRLQEEFTAELATLRGAVDALEARTAELEANQFSTTTKLSGETIFAISDIFGGTDQGVEDDNETVFQYRSRLNFDASFTGRDRLRTRLQAANFNRFDSGTSETRFGFDTNTDGAFEIDTLSYQFPVGDRIRLAVFANGQGVDDLAFGNVINPLESSARGAVSRFGRYNPIYRGGPSNAGASISFQLNDRISFQTGYSSDEAADPSVSNGLFNGNYSVLGQLTARPFDDLRLALTYIHSYAGGDTGFNTGTGSSLARVRTDRPVAINSYGLQANYTLNSNIQIGGWVGYSFVRAIGTGDAEVLNYAVTLAFPDLGGEGNLGGLIFGMQPRLQDASTGLATLLGADEDEDTGFHIEGFYRIALTDNIDITPGFFWLTAPNHNQDNDDIIVGTVRTTFRF